MCVKGHNEKEYCISIKRTKQKENLKREDNKIFSVHEQIEDKMDPEARKERESKEEGGLRCSWK